MTRCWWLLSLLAACRAENAPPPPATAELEVRATSGAIAVQNLEHQIEQAEKQGPMRKEQLVELLLMRSQLLGVHASLDRAIELTEKAESAEELVLRARVRSALHRFTEALADLDAAEKAGADVSRERATIAVASGRAEEVIGSLEKAAKEQPSYASLTALATACAALGRFDEAERAYLDAIRDLRSTSPFPFAWVHFSRGVMWSERAGDRERGAKCYGQAIELLPQYAAANVHLAEIEAARGEVGPAIDRLRTIVKTSDDPEPLALLGQLAKDPAANALARSRYEALIGRHALAFADHAAEFYMTRDPELAYGFALMNLENRETERALALAIEAARAAGKTAEASSLIERAKAKKRTGVELAGF